MRPLFEVGEEVIVDSRYYSEYNGMGVISEILTGEDIKLALIKIGVSPEIYGSWYAPYFYIIPNLPYPEKIISFVGNIGWGESSLRKKLEPGSDFEEFMQGLNEPVFIEE